MGEKIYDIDLHDDNETVDGTGMFDGDLLYQTIDADGFVYVSYDELTELEYYFKSLSTKDYEYETPTRILNYCKEVRDIYK